MLAAPFVCRRRIVWRLQLLNFWVKFQSVVAVRCCATRGGVDIHRHAPQANFMTLTERYQAACKKREVKVTVRSTGIAVVAISDRGERCAVSGRLVYVRQRRAANPSFAH